MRLSSICLTRSFEAGLASGIVSNRLEYSTRCPEPVHGIPDEFGGHAMFRTFHHYSREICSSSTQPREWSFHKNFRHPCPVQVAQKSCHGAAESLESSCPACFSVSSSSPRMMSSDSPSWSEQCRRVLSRACSKLFQHARQSRILCGWVCVRLRKVRKRRDIKRKSLDDRFKAE